MVKLQKIKMLAVMLCAALIVFGMVSSASAIPVNITTATSWVASGSETSNAQVLVAVRAYLFGVTGNPAMPEAYKGGSDGTEEGAFASSYVTAFGPGNETATITWVANPAIGQPAWLLAKDGTGETEYPAWRLYSLTDLGWTGTELITLGQLWPGNDSFSHVSIFSDSTGITVSEPLTLLLLGFGLVGLGVMRFRK